MDNKFLVDTDKIQRFYKDYTNKHGVSCGWSSIESAITAYTAASNCVDQRWSDFQTVLDVGSSDGHLLPFLRSERNFQGQYTGVELIPSSHENAIKFYGKEDQAEFICSEFLSYDFGTRKFDWVMSLGGLSVKQEQQQEYDLAFCRKMVSLARYGITVYLNDINQMPPGRLEQFPDLAAHNINDFVSMLKKENSTSKVEFVHFPSPNSQKTMIHLVLSEY